MFGSARKEGAETHEVSCQGWGAGLSPGGIDKAAALLTAGWSLCPAGAGWLLSTRDV